MSPLETGRHPVIYIISDSIGETAELVGRAAASQFDSGNAEIRRVPYVTHPEEIPEIVAQAARDAGIIIFTLVMPHLREMLLKEAHRHGLPAVDILGRCSKRWRELRDASRASNRGLCGRSTRSTFAG